MTAVHQFVPVLAGRDAIGRHTFAARDLLRAAGYESEIYAEELRPELIGQAKPIEDLPRGDGIWLLYQCSTGSELGSHLADHGEAVIVNYHNITPAELFMPWEPLVGREMLKARKQLARVVPKARGALAVSSFNAAAARRARLPARRSGSDPPRSRPTSTKPPTVSPRPASRATRRMEVPTGSSWAASRRTKHSTTSCSRSPPTVRPSTRTPGSGWWARRRHTTTKRRIGDLIDDLGLQDAVHVVGSSSPAELIAYYRGRRRLRLRLRP